MSQAAHPNCVAPWCPGACERWCWRPAHAPRLRPPKAAWLFSAQLIAVLACLVLIGKSRLRQKIELLWRERLRELKFFSRKIGKRR